MARDLFAETYTPRPQPKRSRWTIGGSLFAHAAAVGVLLVVPILSVTDTLIVEARKIVFVAPPPPAVPPMPPPPASRPTQPAPVALDPTIAPAFAPEKPVTDDTPMVGTPTPVPAGSLGAPSGGQPAGILTGSRTTELGTPPPVPAQSGPIRPGGDIKAPARITYVPPVYPTIAQTAKVEGQVILEAIIDESGVVRDVKVLRSIPLLDRAAIEAVSKWRYTPTRLNGTPVAIIMTVTVMFSLR